MYDLLCVPIAYPATLCVDAQTEKALPTVVVYCDGEILGNHVRITDNLGKGYSNEDLEAFLHE